MRPVVLTVDDDERMRKLLRVNLATDGIEVQEANTGSECLRIIQHMNIDLVLLDLDLPDGSGWDVLASVRTTLERSTLPVIVLSSAPPDRKMLRRLKPEDYVQKPFDARDLTARIRKVLNRKVQQL